MFNSWGVMEDGFLEAQVGDSTTVTCLLWACTFPFEYTGLGAFLDESDLAFG